VTVFDEMVQGTAWAAMVLTRGRTVTYTPHGGQGTSITAVWTESEVLAGYMPDSEQEVRLGLLRASALDVSDPDTRDTVTMDGVTWAVVFIGRTSPIVDLQLETRRVRRVIGGDRRIDR